MSNVVVVGLQWGDEAKGKVVDYLAQDADFVVRYNGGNNAGHTVVVGDEVFKFHTVPVGVLNEGVTAVVTDGVVLDPEVFTGELDGLKDRGVTADKIKISGNAHVLMPYHKLLDGLEESLKGDAKIGTTGRGIGPCYADKMSRIGIRISEFTDPQRFRDSLDAALKIKNAIITKVYGLEPLDADAIYNEYSVYAEKIRPYVAATEGMLFEAVREGANIVFEGAHGSLLDIDHGTYPFATSSHCVSGGATVGTGVGPTMIDRVIGVAKVYQTRVGEGPFPTELFDATGEKIRERGNEYGTTTGRPRRCGWLDLVALRYTTRINAVSCLAVTLLDVLSGFEKLNVCTKYEIDGKQTDYFPSDSCLLKKVKPVYEELPGWSEDISGVRSFDELPVNARRYLARIAEVTETPICLAGVGRKRSQTIILDPEMLAL